MNLNKIRNFSIIAHIDHGKSTLADRMIELTHTVDERQMREQLLDTMDIEQERGITIKMQPVRMEYKSSDGNAYIFNLIDTPGHVDFYYEVSRSLAAVEGALLVVDATQGIQAQTLANLHLALEEDLEIIPVINKIDMPSAQIEKVSEEISKLLYGDANASKEKIIKISAKTGQNIPELMERIVQDIPHPQTKNICALKALIFDSTYDNYQGVLAYIRVIDGEVKKGDKLYLISTQEEIEVLEVGIFKPDRKKIDKLSAGEIGYIVTGLKDLSSVKVGDTIIKSEEKDKSQTLKLPGYKKVNPMVFAGIYPKNSEEFEQLREALEKINLNDSSFQFVPEKSQALGPGFRCGFLGLLHLDIIKERVIREFGIELVITMPSVEYKVELKSGEVINVRRPQDMPDPSAISRTYEPWANIEIVTPKDYIGAVMAVLQEKRGQYRYTEYLDKDRVILKYSVPLASILTDFYDKIKSVSRGFASVSWGFEDWKESKIVKLDILIAEHREESLSQLVFADDAYRVGRKMVERLKEVLPRQLFVVKIQAAIGGKIIAAERLSALKKDVTAKLYGGDVTRKMKLIEKQKKGKKRMMQAGKVDIPTNIYFEILKKE